MKFLVDGDPEWPEPPIYWYRFEDYIHMSHNEFDELIYRSARVRVLKFRVIKLTPKGVRLDNDRLVLIDSKKQYASPSIEEARASFIARKERQLAILRNQCNDILTAKSMAELKFEDKP